MTITAERLRVYRVRRVRRGYRTKAERLRDTLRAIAAAHAASVEPPVRAALIAAAERAVAEAAEAVALTGALPEAAALYASFADDLAVITLPAAEATAESVAAAINASQVLPSPVSVTDTARALVRTRVRERMRDISGTRVGQWNQLVRDRIRMGWTPDQIINGGGPVPFEGAVRPGIRDILGQEDYRNQALTIARTESSYARAETELQIYAEQGIRRVRVFDGVDDAPCAAANGSTWSVEEAAANPIAHPNCRRSFEPIIE